MEVSNVKNDIVTKNLKDFYIFSGDEWEVQKIYINQIAKVAGKKIKRIDSIADIYSQLNNRSFVKQSFVYVCRDDEELLGNEKLWARINEKILGDNIYILLLTTIDKRTKFYKAFNAKICEFKALNDATLYKYLNAKINLSKANLERLIDICEHDYGRCLLEVDKIINFINDTPVYFPDDAFKILVESGTIYRPPKDAIFDFVEAVLKRQVNKAFELLGECYAVGEATMVMLSVLYNNARSVLQVQSYEGDNLAKATGLSAWEIKLAKAKLNYFSEEELIYILQTIQFIESGIKVGKIDEDVAMQYLLSQIL